VGTTHRRWYRPWPVLAALVLEVVAGTWTFLVIGLVWWANLPQVVGWTPRVVLSGSMLPSLAPGDVVLVGPVSDPRSLATGRLAVVRDDARAGGSYVHRVVRREPGGNLVTRGDANRVEDRPVVTPDRVLGEVRMVVPLAGLPSLWVGQRRFLPLVLVALGTWITLIVTVRSCVIVRQGDPKDGSQRRIRRSIPKP
jgi:signal peptidase